MSAHTESLPIGLLIGARAGVVMGANDHPGGFLGVDPSHQIGHFHRGAGTFSGGLEFLERDFEALGLEMLLKHFLLFLHSGGTAHPGADGANGGDVLERPGRIKRNLVGDGGNTVLGKGIGAALLGLRIGDIIDWPLPDGSEIQLRIDAIFWQPEREGQFHR